MDASAHWKRPSSRLSGRGTIALTIARRISPPTALFILAAAASGVLLIALQSHLTFVYDDWDPLLDRRAWSAHDLLRPHLDHILLATTLVYKAIQATIGMESLVPYAVASTSVFLLSAALLFVYIRRRVGEWLALAGVLPILFLGTAAGDLLAPFQIFFFGSMACGLGALLAIEGEGSRRDLLACALLAVSFTFSELALPFVLGVAVAIGLDRGPLRRAYVVLVPLLLYALWYAGWGHTAPSALSFSNVAHSLGYVLEGLAAGVASLFGLTTGGAVNADLGRPLLLGLLLLAALRIRSGPPVSRWFWVSLVVLLSFWFLTAVNAMPLRPPDTSRYQYIGAVLLLLVAADLADGLARNGWSLAVVVIALAVAAASVAGNLAALHHDYVFQRDGLRLERGGLTGLEIESDHADPAFTLNQQNAGFKYFGSIVAGPYLSAVREFGSPAYSESELSNAPEGARVSADLVMGSVLRPTLRPAPQRPGVEGPAPSLVGPPGALAAQRGGCISVSPAAGASPVIAVPPSGVFLKAARDESVSLHLRRFATQSFPVSAGRLAGSAILTIPPDRSSRPWQLQLGTTGVVTACRA
jgi:hypothetical protein